MANIIITSKGNSGVFVNFGDYASSELLSPQGFNSGTIEHIEPSSTGAVVKTRGRDSQTWYVTDAALTGYMIIDLIDGVAPSSQSDLIEKLTALL